MQFRKLVKELMSVFQKLLQREFGALKYQKYFSIYETRMQTKMQNTSNSGSQEIFADIYKELKDQDFKVLCQKSDRLTDAMTAAVQISRMYMISFVFYLAAALFLIAQSLLPVITIIALLLMSVCFIYKTYEFVVNKFCYIDAYIIIVYKTVLDQLIAWHKLKEKK